MKILFILPQEYNGETWGGIMTYVSDMSQALAARGHNVAVYAPGKKNAFSTRNNVSYYASPIKPAGSEIAKRLYWAWQVRQFVNKHAHFDIIEAPEWGSSTLLLSGSRNTRIVVRLHKSELQYKQDNLLPLGISDYIIDFFERLCILRASSVTSPTRFMARQYLFIGAVRKAIGLSIQAIPNGISGVSGNGLKRSHAEPYFLTVGRIELAKGSDLLAEVFVRISRFFPRIRLIFIGEDTQMPIKGAWQMCGEYIKRLAAAHGISHRIRFIPKQPHNKLGRYYDNCLAYIAPSRGHENASMSVLEALMHRKAVIAGDAGGTPEIVRNNINGMLFRADDADDLEAKLRYILMHPAARRRWEKAASGSVVPFEKAVDLTETSYKRALK